MLALLGELVDDQLVLVLAERELKVPRVFFVAIEVTPLVLPPTPGRGDLVLTELSLGDQCLHETERAPLFTGPNLEVLPRLQALHDVRYAAGLQEAGSTGERASAIRAVGTW